MSRLASLARRANLLVPVLALLLKPGALAGADDGEKGHGHERRIGDEATELVQQLLHVRHPGLPVDRFVVAQGGRARLETLCRHLLLCRSGRGTELPGARERRAGDDGGEALLVAGGTRRPVSAEAVAEQCHSAGPRAELRHEQVDDRADRLFGLRLPVQAVLHSDALPRQVGHRYRIAALEHIAADGQEDFLEARVRAAEQEHHRCVRVGVLDEHPRQRLAAIRHVEEGGWPAEVGDRRPESGLVPGVEAVEDRAHRGELPRRAVAGERLQPRLRGLPFPAGGLPLVGLLLLAVARRGERGHPARGITVLDRRGDMEPFAHREPAGSTPAEGDDEEQVHVGVVEAVPRGKPCVRVVALFAGRFLGHCRRAVAEAAAGHGCAAGREQQRAAIHGGACS